ncbi:MAG: B12-binding domain-containing radical SAM protein [Oligoflexia bacterium]|nr:B12-binding domain-containing radical SAM protein [Oligoflexia bacterium]
MRVLLLTPPLTQLNTPYPATAYLTGFLRARGHEVAQGDLSIELILRLFSRSGLERIETILRGRAKTTRAKPPEVIRNFLEKSARYVEVADPVLRFLQGTDPTLALRIVSREFLPEGPRFAALDEELLGASFGNLGMQDRAKYLASLFIDDLADLVREGIDPHFGFSRYGESLAASIPSFDPLAEALEGEPTLVDVLVDELAAEFVERHRPEVVGLTAPFPGNVYGAFRIARQVKALHPSVKVVLGGGYVNTELRGLSEARVFDFFDFVTLDDGERPFLNLLEHLARKLPEETLSRTFLRKNGKVVFQNDPAQHDIPFRDSGTPTYDGLPLGKYLSLLELLNPMHRIWSDGRWNKLTVAHGCYWRKCNFCDTSLDYIARYDAAPADLLVDRIEALIRETGQTGFHFVDEAAPPAMLRALAERLLARKVAISWWGNIRFEKTFTPELAKLLARSGCIAVSGGLEVASDRLLKLMQKGVTVEQVARVTRAFTEAGIMVHAYLMYGFPTQTEQETLDSLERVRQLFAAGCLQSAYWHRFSATAHSPIGREPERFGIRLKPEPRARFARNDLAFDDPTPSDHELLGEGLRKALYNYMHGAGLELDVRGWFGKKMPRTTVHPRLVERALEG